MENLLGDHDLEYNDNLPDSYGYFQLILANYQSVLNENNTHYIENTFEHTDRNFNAIEDKIFMVEAIRRTINDIFATNDGVLRGLNFLLSDGNCLYAYCDWDRGGANYYTMHIADFRRNEEWDRFVRIRRPLEDEPNDNVGVDQEGDEDGGNGVDGDDGEEYDDVILHKERDSPFVIVASEPIEGNMREGDEFNQRFKKGELVVIDKDLLISKHQIREPLND